MLWSHIVQICMYVWIEPTASLHPILRICGAPQLRCQHISVPTENKSLWKPFLTTAKQIFNPECQVHTRENNFPLTFCQFAYEHWLGKDNPQPHLHRRRRKIQFSKSLLGNTSVIWLTPALSGIKVKRDLWVPLGNSTLIKMAMDNLIRTLTLSY